MPAGHHQCCDQTDLILGSLSEHTHCEKYYKDVLELKVILNLMNEFPLSGKVYSHGESSRNYMEQCEKMRFDIDKSHQAMLQQVGE